MGRRDGTDRCGRRPARRRDARARRDASTTDVYVSLLGALMDTYLNRVSGEADHPTFVPCCGYYQHLGSPNPDTVYRRAPVDDTATTA